MKYIKLLRLFIFPILLASILGYSSTVNAQQSIESDSIATDDNIRIASDNSGFKASWFSLALGIGHAPNNTLKTGVFGYYSFNLQYNNSLFSTVTIRGIYTYDGEGLTNFSLLYGYANTKQLRRSISIGPSFGSYRYFHRQSFGLTIKAEAFYSGQHIGLGANFLVNINKDSNYIVFMLTVPLGYLN